MPVKPGSASHGPSLRPMPGPGLGVESALPEPQALREAGVNAWRRVAGQGKVLAVHSSPQDRGVLPLGRDVAFFHLCTPTA